MKCGFCGKEMLSLSFESWNCGGCQVLYNRDMEIQYAYSLYRKPWKDVPRGTLVVLEKLSVEVKPMYTIDETETVKHVWVKREGLSVFRRFLVWLTGRGGGDWMEVRGPEGTMWVGNL